MDIIFFYNAELARDRMATVFQLDGERGDVVVNCSAANSAIRAMHEMTNLVYTIQKRMDAVDSSFEVGVDYTLTELAGKDGVKLTLVNSLPRQTIGCLIAVIGAIQSIHATGKMLFSAYALPGNPYPALCTGLRIAAYHFVPSEAMWMARHEGKLANAALAYALASDDTYAIMLEDQSGEGVSLLTAIAFSDKLDDWVSQKVVTEAYVDLVSKPARTSDDAIDRIGVYNLLTYSHKCTCCPQQ